MPLSSSLFTTAVRGDVLPAVGSLLVPGALAAGPYVALLWGPPHNLKMFVEESEGLSAVVGALVVVAAGLLIESIGSYAEYYLIDRVHKNKEEMFSRWQEYLQLSWDREPVGQHYLRRTLTIFKFELNLFVGNVAALIGVCVLAYYAVLTTQHFPAALVLQLLLLGYLWKATSTSALLLDTPA